MSGKLSVLSINEDTREKVLNYLKLADSAHDFKGERSNISLTTDVKFQTLMTQNNIQKKQIVPSTIEHEAQNIILELTDNIDEKNVLSKLINNSEYNFEITINNELNNTSDKPSIDSLYQTGTQVIKELKLNIEFDRILHGNKLKNKKFFSKAVLDYFLIKYNKIYGMNNKEYLIDAANIPISYFLSSNSSTNTYTQLIEESNKWDMAPTSAPDSFRNICETFNFDKETSISSHGSSESIVTSIDGDLTKIYNNTDINNISEITIEITSDIFKKFKHSFLYDSNYSYILLKTGEYTMNAPPSSKKVPICTRNLKCFTVNLTVNNRKNNCYGYIVFINEDRNICLLASNAYRKNQEASIGVNTLSSNLKSWISYHKDLIDITTHLSCDPYTFILDIKRTGDWSQIIQVNNQYLSGKKKITFISLDYLAILFAKLINIPYIHTSLNEHFVSFTMRNAELAQLPSPQDIFTNLIGKIDNLINKFNSFLDSDFFTNYRDIDEQLKILLFETDYTFTYIDNPLFIKNIFRFMYNVINNVFLQHINNIKTFYALQTDFERIRDKTPIEYNDNIVLNSIYAQIEKKYLLIENINSELDINSNNLIELSELNGIPNTNQKTSLSKLDAIKKKFLFKITIMKGNMNFAKSIIFLIDKLIDLNNITPTSLERLAIKNKKNKNEIILNIYKQILSIINKIYFYKGIPPINDESSQFSLDYNSNITNINTILTNFKKNTDQIPIFKITNELGAVLMNGGGIGGLFGKTKLTIKQLPDDWKTQADNAFKSNQFHYKKNQVSKPNITQKLNFYYSTLNLDSSSVKFNIAKEYGSITKILCNELISNKNYIVLAYINQNRAESRTQNNVLEYNIIEKDQPNNLILRRLRAENKLHVVARKFFLIFAEKIFIQRINKFLRYNQLTSIQTIDLHTARETRYYNTGSVDYDVLVNDLNVPIINTDIIVYDEHNYLYYDFLYFINLPLYGDTFNTIINETQFGNIIQRLKRNMSIYTGKILSWFPKINHLLYLKTNENIQIDKEEYINNISDMIINDETYEKLKNLRDNLPIYTNHTTFTDSSEYQQWHTHLLIFTDILEKIEENRVIIFGIEEGGGGGGIDKTNNYICHENLRQVYISLKYLVSIHNDVIYAFEAQTFKNICHFFQIDIPEKIDVTKRDNIKNIIDFINKIFVKRYLCIKQDIIENQIYTDWEKEDITDFFGYYDMYTTIKDYHNIVIEINELMMNNSYDVEYCVKQLWGSVESLDMYVEQYFKFKYNDNLILSHQGELVNSDIYISKTTNDTLLKDVDKLPKLPEKKNTIIWEDIVKDIENGRYNRDTLKTFIDYLNSNIVHSSTQEHPTIQAHPINEIRYFNPILAHGGSDKTQPTIKKQSRKKK